MEKKPINDMTKQLAEAQQWELKLSKNLQYYISLKSSPLQSFFASVQILKDWHLGDAQIQIQQPKIDYKIRSPKYFRFPPDFCIELKTGIKKGWFYTTDNIIYYAWKVLREANPLQNHLLDGYFLRIPTLRNKYPQWIEKMIKKYFRENPYSKSTNENGVEWKTYNVYVPFREFPLDTIFRFNLDPNPTSKQTRLK